MPLAARRLPALALLATALAGCTTVGPDFTAPTTPPVTGYAMSGDPAAPGVRLVDEVAAKGAWWQAIGGSELDAVVRLAFANSPTLNAAKATLERTQALSDVTRGEQGPQADATAGARRTRINTRTFGFTGFPPRNLNLYSIGAQVSYDLDLFGGGRRSSERDKARATAAAREVDAAYLTLAGNVVAQAVRIASVRAQISATEAVIEDDRQILVMMRAADAAGGEARTAGANALAQLLTDQAALSPLQSELAAARHRLALLVGRSPGEWAAPDFDLAKLTVPNTIPLSLPSSLVRRRPDILAAEAELHAATAAIGVAQADRYPDLRLTASLTQTALGPEDLFGYGASGWNLGSGLTAPLFQSRTLRAKLHVAEAEAKVADARYRETVLRAFVQVSDSLAALAAGEKAVTVWRLAERAAIASDRDARAAYALGGVPRIRVIETQRVLDRVGALRAQTEGQRLMDVVELYAATASDWRATPVPASTDPAGP